MSEVMLQQTQAGRVVPFYESFLERFPTVDRLAAASPADVLRAWGNLGYNRRALNLWRTARAISERGGSPTTVDELQQLPGVGSYTARAVASFAFGREVAAVDANVRRVVMRFFGPDTNVQEFADRLVPRGRAGVWNQAMIDLGAEVCRARTPGCDRCPLRTGCAWNAGVRPAPNPRSPTPRFEDTTRYARGRVVKALRDASGSLTSAQIAAATKLQRTRATRAIESLVADGLVVLAGRRVSLPATEPSRAASRRR